MSSRLSTLTVLAAVVLAVLLLGGSATQASWTDSTSSEATTTLTAGSLTGHITQTGPTTMPVETPREVGILWQEGAEGLIPGVQGQQWSYRLFNDASSNVAADATLRLQGTPHNTNDYEKLRPFLRATVEVEGQPEPIAVPVASFTSSGFTYDVELGARLQPGEDLRVTVTFFVPESTASNPNLAVTLNSLRSGNTTTHSIFTMTNAMQLHQAGDPL